MNLYKSFGKLLMAASCIAGVSLLASCKDEDIFNPDYEVERQDNLPVEIKVILPEYTRSVYPKTTFSDGELIHVQGVFHMDDDTDEIKYAAFRMEGGKWVQYGGNEGSINVQRFTWPNNAVDAEFTAYYVAETQSLLSPTTDPSSNPATLLSTMAGQNNQPDTDPLFAESGERVRYGHTIVLQFKHACAYLTVEEMAPGVDTYWFTQRTEEGDAVSPDFKNAYKLWLNTDNTISFQFVQAEDPNYENLVYVSGKSQSEWLDGKETASFGIFLAPGQYDNFVIGYPGASSMVEYLNYRKKGPNQGPNGEPDPNPDNLMKANGVYTFNISRSAGLQITTPPGSQEWDEDEDPIYEVDAEKFLYSICYPQDYEVEYHGQMVRVLEQIGNGTRLLKNVNMQWAEYNVFPKSETNEQKWFVPDLGRGNTFDGGQHYIWNLGSPLFNTVNGTIKNLGITNVKFSVTTQDQYIPEDYTPEGPTDPAFFDLSRAGALCNYVQEGTIQNIRVRSKLPIEATFDPSTWTPESGLPYYEDIFQMNVTTFTERDQEAHSIGCVIGSSLNGVISDITIMCDMNLTVESSPESTYFDPTLSIGGIIGQSLNVLNNVGTDNSVLYRAPQINITNKCSDTDGAYYLGGILGLHGGGTVNNVILPSINIEARSSSCFNSFIGGAAGSLGNRSEGGELLNCSVSGSVYAGKSEMPGEFVATSYTGGLAGECFESYTVNGCQSVVKVIGPYNGGSYQNYIGDGTVTYGVGGVFGIIQRVNNSGQTPESIGNIIGYGDQLQGPPSIGNFAGIVPSGETWENDYAGRDITVKVHTNVDKFIGSE